LGALTSSALLDVRALNFHVSYTCLLAEAGSSTIISSKLLDILLSLSALCAATPARVEFLYVAVRGVANEWLKLALRLVYLGIDSAWFNQAPFPEFQELLCLTALLFLWGFTTQVPFTSQNMRTCHAMTQKLLLSAETGRFLDQMSISSVREDLTMWMFVILGSTVVRIQACMVYADLMLCTIPHAVNCTCK
jgi:hypothetical protein